MRRGRRCGTGRCAGPSVLLGDVPVAGLGRGLLAVVVEGEPAVAGVGAPAAEHPPLEAVVGAAVRLDSETRVRLGLCLVRVVGLVLPAGCAVPFGAGLTVVCAVVVGWEGAPAVAAEPLAAVGVGDHGGGCGAADR